MASEGQPKSRPSMLGIQEDYKRFAQEADENKRKLNGQNVAKSEGDTEMTEGDKNRSTASKTARKEHIYW